MSPWDNDIMDNDGEDLYPIHASFYCSKIYSLCALLLVDSGLF